jgi:deazaflavin-dependent oxidoreductase (nitroreductase family)
MRTGACLCFGAKGKLRVGLNRLANLLVGAILRSPLHRWLSGSLILITYVGRRSGVQYTLPVQYASANGELLVSVGRHQRKQWWRNLRVRSPVRVLYKGRLLDASAVALSRDADAIAPRLAVYFRRFPGAAQARGVTLGPRGEMDLSKLREAAAHVVLVSVTLAADSRSA